jgi:acyl-CoA synthetase (AMP-forming)/AMP-acid ligase II
MTTRPGGAQMNIANGVREFAIATPGRVAVVDGERRLNYAALHERSSRLANVLLAEGLRTGDRVGVVLGNRMEYCETAAGIAKAGMVTVPVNPRMTAPEVTDILGRSSARALVLDEAYAGACADAVEDGGITTVLSMDGTSLGDDYERVLASAGTRDPQIEVDELDPFTIAFTGGTTGVPKGVMISHRSRCLTFVYTALEWGLGPGRSTIAVAPMYHGAGFAFAYTAVVTGGTVSMLRAWDPERFLGMVASDRPSTVFLVPAHLQMLRAKGDDALARADTAGLETIYVNAAPLPQALKLWALDQLPDVGFHELYGSTEASVVTNLRPEDMRRKERCVGPPWFATEVRLLDAEGNEVGDGEPGELYSRSPFVFNGYLDDPEATEACTTPDGFVSAGDVAIRDDEGYLYIIDRTKDMILSGGVNVYPREVEEVLATHPQVAEVAVVGLPDEQWGESVTAVVVPRGAPPSLDDLVAHARGRLAGFKLPKSLQVVDELPRNLAGKILKRELRDRFAGPGEG